MPTAPRTRKIDIAWKSEVTLSNGWQLARDWRLHLGGDFRSELWNEFTDFNHAGGGATAGLRYRFGLGPAGALALAREPNRLRSFSRYRSSGWDEVASAARRNRSLATDRARGRLTPSRRSPRRTVSAIRRVTARSARVIFDLTSSLQVGLGYTFRDGDIVSYAVPPRPDIVQLASELRSVATFGTSPLTLPIGCAGRHTLFRVRRLQPDEILVVQLGLRIRHDFRPRAAIREPPRRSEVRLHLLSEILRALSFSFRSFWRCLSVPARST